jgi:hypothetical protein
MPTVSAIRTLFLEPKPTYSLPEAASLLGMEVTEVRGWVEVGELAGVEGDDGSGSLGRSWCRSRWTSGRRRRWRRPSAETSRG